MTDEQTIDTEAQEPDYLSPIRVYRIADGSLATEPDSSGKSVLAYSVGKVVADEDDITAINALAGIEPEVEQSTIKKILIGKKKKRAKK